MRLEHAARSLAGGFDSFTLRHPPACVHELENIVQFVDMLRVDPPGLRCAFWWGYVPMVKSSVTESWNPAWCEAAQHASMLTGGLGAFTSAVLAAPADCWPDGVASLWPDVWAHVGVTVARELGWVTGSLTSAVWERVVDALEVVVDAGRDENDLFGAVLLWVCHDAGVAALPGGVLVEVAACVQPFGL